MEAGSIAQVAVFMVASGLIDPLTIVPGLILGWICRRGWQVVLAAVAMTALRLAYALGSGLPMEGEVLWWLLPLGVLPALSWCWAGHLLRRRVVTPGGKQERIGWVVAALPVGAVLGGTLAAVVGTVWSDLARVSNFEGQAGYAVFFFFVLPGILIGGALAVWLALRLTRR